MHRLLNTIKRVGLRDQNLLVLLVLVNTFLLMCSLYYNFAHNTEEVASNQNKKLSDIVEPKLNSLEIPAEAENKLPSVIGDPLDVLEFETDTGLEHDSWKLPSSEFKNMPMYDDNLKFPHMKLDNRKHNGKIVSLYNHYAMLIPLSKSDNINWFKNYYSDVNTKFVCDATDMREGCHIRLKKDYSYDSLPAKTGDMFEALCNHIKEKENGDFSKYKFVAKMDIDTIVDKSYLYTVVKYFADNRNQRIFGGRIYPLSDKLVSLGHFYGINQAVLRDYCSCPKPEPYGVSEDFWFGDVVKECVESKPDFEENRMVYIRTDWDLIRHKIWVEDGVNVTIGYRNFDLIFN